jgi:predicted small lipoprotein YifL
MKRPLLILPGPSLVVMAVLLLELSACGLREPLAPAQGQHMPPAPAMASRAMTTDELITPPAIARPERLDELLQRSEERHDDRFDLPPGDIPAASGNVPADSNASGDPPQ